MSDDIIRKALGMGVPEVDDAKALVPMPIENAEVTEVDEVLEKDIEFVRENTIELIAQGQEALSELLLIAKQSQHPRAFEVIANLLKTNSELNEGLLSIHKKKKELKPQEQSSAPHKVGTVNNNLFVGSTADLQKMLADMSKKNGN